MIKVKKIDPVKLLAYLMEIKMVHDIRDNTEAHEVVTRAMKYLDVIKDIQAMSDREICEVISLAHTFTEMGKLFHEIAGDLAIQWREENKDKLVDLQLTPPKGTA